jgi:hypothetical protein
MLGVGVKKSPQWQRRRKGVKEGALCISEGATGDALAVNESVVRKGRRKDRAE